MHTAMLLILGNAISEAAPNEEKGTVAADKEVMKAEAEVVAVV